MGKINIKEKLAQADAGAKKMATAAKQFVDEKTPVVLEKADKTAEKAKELADNVMDDADQAIKKADVWIKTKQEADRLRKFNYENDTLMPIFDDRMPANYDNFPVVNIVDYDEKRSKSEACEGSIGFFTEAKDVKFLNIYTKHFNNFPIKLDEEAKAGVYFVNPYIPGEYIESSRYSRYLQEERVRELVNIADSLGAKYVSVTYATAEKKADEVKADVKAKYGRSKAEFQAEEKMKEALKSSIDKLEEFDGHDNPTYPKLVYYKNDKDILEMIEKRMNGKNPLRRHTYSIAYASSSDAKMKESVKIDGAIKALKLGASESLTVCSSVESQIRLSYTIEF